MDIRQLKDLSISHLILIILNDESESNLRQCAEFELRSRIRNMGWEYDHLLHFDDKVIEKRGLDVDNYLISPNVDMQQLMETYFMYDHGSNFDSSDLLFSEKHICNQVNFADTFFAKVCSKEAKNIGRRIVDSYDEADKELLIHIRYLLLKRTQAAKQCVEEAIDNDYPELLCSSEPLFQLQDWLMPDYNFWYNISDEEGYKILTSKLGMLKFSFLEFLNDTLFDNDIVDDWAGLRFIQKDSAKLKKQKAKLLQQVENDYVVNYESENMRKALQKIKK